MKILFDHQAFSLHTYGGVSRYFSELIHGINLTPDYSAALPLLFSNNIHLKEKGFDINHFLLNKDFKRKKRLIYEINKFYSLLALKKKQYDILHPTYFDSYFIPYLNRKPLVVTFHDMIHEKFSDQFKELTFDRGIIARKKLMANQADRIIAVSESTKRDIVELLNIKPEKIEVVYHGCSFPPSVVSSTEEPDPVPFPYLLYVGSRQVYKNFGGMLTAIQPVLKKYRLKLLCAGGGGFTESEHQLIQSLGISDLVEQHVINDQILRKLYQQAVAFIFPSLYEGFGIPILEAFDCGCPCIVNNSSSLPEVAGEAALYVNFNEPDSVIDAVERLLSDTELKQQLIKKGKERLREFSWKNTVDSTLRLYKELG
ncbi:glycosyltransferase family 4 protein [Spirosoma validum]|uniref:Glycosyltransferase family 4 protein n=1 Tax=Spirosoma validum TaxID=2771355 RepID=A0A927AYN5_9BACT|nr:glycosyltransferase family 1 protein [Spirosoma validum]MBD2752286.1 glycosyltransferase family 4 protein [Spirosoma validum]